MAGIKAAILSLITKLEAVPGLQHVRVWNNQISDEDSGKLYDFPKPAVFIEVRSPDPFLPLGGSYTQSDITIAIHLVHEQFDAGDGTFEQNLDVYDIQAAINMALTNFQPDQCGRMFKVAEVRDDNHTNIYHYISEWMTGLIDNGGVDPSAEITKDPPTTLIINHE